MNYRMEKTVYLKSTSLGSTFSNTVEMFNLIQMVCKGKVSEQFSGLTLVLGVVGKRY